MRIPAVRLFDQAIDREIVAKDTHATFRYARFPGEFRSRERAIAQGIEDAQIDAGFECRAPACELVALNFPSVLEVTSEHARAAGIPLTLLPGSAFTADLGTGYDAILVTNLYHHFSADDNIKLMKRFHAAMRPGAQMMVLEMVPNADRITPPSAASFSMMMLGNTSAGDAYTMGEYNEMLDAAGFGAREVMDVPMSPQQLIVARRSD